MNSFKKMWSILPPHSRRSAVKLFFLMLLGMLLETLGVGIVAPFISIFTQDSLSTQYPSLTSVLNAIGNPEQEVLFIYIMLLLLGIYLVKNLFLAFLAWKQMRFSYDVRVFLARKLFRNYLYQPYTFHLQHNSAQLIRNVGTEIGLFNGYGINSTMILLTESLVVLGIVSLLITFEPFGALIVMSVFGIAILGFNSITRKHITRWGKERQYHDGMNIQHLQQGLGGVKVVKMLAREENFLTEFDQHHCRSSKVLQWQQTLQLLPRLWIEFIAVAGIVILVIFMIYRGQSMEDIIPVLGLFVAAAFRLMPSLSRILSAWHALKFSMPVISTLNEEIKLEIKNDTLYQKSEIDAFQYNISLSNVTFIYPATINPALNEISINISCKESVGFIGTSGSGKSTIIDIILGLLTPDSGEVLVDGLDIKQNLRNWQKQIGYVPQSVFLTDDTLRNNIAFGLSDTEVDENAVWRAIKAAQLDEFVSTQSSGLDTIVGERGVRLSGGQQQRIGIARALYHDPPVLVLDEATSSLDFKTENEIMETISFLHGNKTLIIVAHRLSTVENCDRIFRLEKGNIVEEGTPSSVLKMSKKNNADVVEIKTK